MPRKEYTSLPTNYPVCEHSDCPMAASCLHQIAHAMKLKTDELLRLINPDARRTPLAHIIAATAL